jgi:hypothetical protein
MTTNPPFGERLARAAALLAARRAEPIPGHMQDQVLAAAAEMQHLVAPLINYWRANSLAERPGDAILQVHLIATMLDSRTCCHLRRSGHPQPMWGLLAFRLLVCHRCFHTYRRPPADEADRCDVCGSRGHSRFWPIQVSVGPAVFLGDAGSCCAEALGLIALTGGGGSS